MEDPIAVDLVTSALWVTIFGLKGASTASAPPLPSPALILPAGLNPPVLLLLLLLHCPLLLPDPAAVLKAL